jgi:hypothetical protein
MFNQNETCERDHSLPPLRGPTKEMFTREGPAGFRHHRPSTPGGDQGNVLLSVVASSGAPLRTSGRFTKINLTIDDNARGKSQILPDLSF